MTEIFTVIKHYTLKKAIGEQYPCSLCVIFDKAALRCKDKLSNGKQATDCCGDNNYFVEYESES